MKFGKLFQAFFARFGNIVVTSNKVSGLSRQELILFAKKLRTIEGTTIPSNYLTLPSNELRTIVYTNLILLEKQGVKTSIEDSLNISNEDFVMSLDKQDLLELAKKGFEEGSYHISPRYDVVNTEELRCMVYLYLEQPEKKWQWIVDVDLTAGEPPKNVTNV